MNDAIETLAASVENRPALGEFAKGLAAEIRALAAQPAAVEPITVEAVATVMSAGGGLYLSWLLEGGLCELVEGDVLFIADKPITDDLGAGVVFTAPPAQARPEWQPIETAPHSTSLLFLVRTYREGLKQVTGKLVRLSAAKLVLLPDAVDMAACGPVFGWNFGPEDIQGWMPLLAAPAAQEQEKGS